MKMLALTSIAVLVIVVSGLLPCESTAGQQGSQAGKTAPAPAQSPEALDRLLAPVALYPDSLLAQMLQCAADPAKVGELDKWLAANTSLKGTELQDAAVKAGFEPSFVALVLFPQVVGAMAAQIDRTSQIGQAFAADRSAVFASIQRLRAQAQKAGNLKSTPQQEVESRTTSSGEQVIVIEPANPQVVYVPQYNPQVVYTTPATTTVVVQENDNDAGAAVAGAVIGFTVGIAIGAAVDNDYYYGPHGWRGGAYMYNDAWDDYYDAREDAREDWMDHREDLAEERTDRAENAQEERTERAENAQEQRTEQQENRQENRPESQAERDQRRTDAPSTTSQARSTGTSASTQEARGYSSGGARATTAERSGTRSDALSGYSSGQSERAASQRGQGSRSSSAGSRRR